MKRFLVSVLFIGLGFLIVGVSIWRSRMPAVTLAVDENLPGEESVTQTAAEAVAEEEDYALPYPGILPDHPLYFLKMARDRIQLWLTRQPVDQAKLLLHYADKRIAAALALAEKGKVGLAASTASKAEGYLERALGAAKTAEIQGKDTTELFRQLFEATEKHEKVLSGVLSRTPDEAKAAVDSVIEVNDRVHEELDKKLDSDESVEENSSLEEEETAEDTAGDESDEEGIEIQDTQKTDDDSEDEGKG